MEQNKRNLLIAGGVVLAVILGVAGYLTMGGSGNGAAVASGSDGAVANSGEALAQEGPMGDIAMGSADAPVTVYEYASLTCNHCAAFHLQSFPQIKEKYIETGQVRWVIRAFPFDPAATAAVMLARCSGPDRYYNFLDVLFEQQQQWAFTGNPGENLEALAKQGGFSSDSYKACLENQEIFDHVRAVQVRAQEVHSVRSTPSFFVNGEKVEGALPFEQFEEVIQKHLP